MMISKLPDAPLDLIGDVHGEHDALARLLHHLGYDERGRHPGGRRLVFVGDLCDRGPDSPRVIQQVRRIVEDGLGKALLGNHELNLLRGERKEGNDWFWGEDSARDRKFGPFATAADEERAALLGFLEQRPLALEREDLRVVHAAWHEPGIRHLRETDAAATLAGQFAHWEVASDAAVNAEELLARFKAEQAEWGHLLGDPRCHMPMLEATALRDELWQMSNPLRVLTSGVERVAREPFFSSGKWRFVERVRWWDEYRDPTPVVIGHYWRRAAPVDPRLVGKGGPDLFDRVRPLDWHGARGNVFCVDFSVGGRFQERACGVPGHATKLAALRWPERTLVFDTGEVQHTGRAMPSRRGAAASGKTASGRPRVEAELPQAPDARSRFLGCLLGGAVGDALGAPVEFMDRAGILERFGPEGITGPAPSYGRLGAITDDTQMTLFTAEGLLRSWVRSVHRGFASCESVTAHAYLRWLMTQGGKPASGLVDFAEGQAGWLFQQPELHHRRAPGLTCLAVLEAMTSLGEPARNDSKGCGGVMRVAPVGLFAWRRGQAGSPGAAFDLGTRLAALTHGHPSGSLTGGVLAVLILALADGKTLPQALETAKACLRAAPRHEETLRSIEQAEALAGSGLPPEDAIARLGEGWVAEEALAISIYCAFVARDFRHGVVLAVNHDGDSDSTGAITGNLLGTRWGVEAIPPEWLEPLELRQVITELAEDLCAFPDWDIGDDSQDPDLDARIWQRYPGC